jgi:hypothetical protein
MKQELQDFLSLVYQECGVKFTHKYHPAVQELLDNDSSKAVLLAIMILREIAGTMPNDVCNTFLKKRWQVMVFIRAVSESGFRDPDRIADLWIAFDENADLSLFSDLLGPNGAARLTEAREQIHASV